MESKSCTDFLQYSWEQCRFKHNSAFNSEITEEKLSPNQYIQNFSINLTAMQCSTFNVVMICIEYSMQRQQEPRFKPPTFLLWANDDCMMTSAFVFWSFWQSKWGWTVLNALEISKNMILAVLPASSRWQWICWRRFMLASSNPTPTPQQKQLTAAEPSDMFWFTLSSSHRSTWFLKVF